MVACSVHWLTHLPELNKTDREIQAVQTCELTQPLSPKLNVPYTFKMISSIRMIVWETSFTIIAVVSPTLEIIKNDFSLHSNQPFNKQKIDRRPPNESFFYLQ